MSTVQGSAEERAIWERLSFTLYHVLRELDPDMKGYLTPTRFNKIVYLIHKDIEQNLKINTGLPWHWYLFGPVVALEYCPPDVYVKQEIREGDWRVFYGREPKVKCISLDQQRQILERVRYWRDKYLTTDDAIDLAYSDVEIPFLKEIKKFSDNIGYGLVDSEEAIISRLDDLIEIYPGENLADLTSLYLRFENVLRISAKTDVTNIRGYATMIEDFRKLTLLRLGVIVSENMPRSWIQQQSDQFAREKERFQSEFDERERELFCSMKEQKDRTGYAKKLMEISWQMYTEG